MLKSALELEIKNIITAFFYEQMCLFPRDIGVKFWDDICMAKGKNTPATTEANFVGDYMYIRQVKIRLFDEVMPVLKEQLENVTSTKIFNIHFFSGAHNTQFLSIVFE